MSQDVNWLRENLGFRVTHHSTRRMWPLQKDHPLVAGVPLVALRDWAGESLHQEARPQFSEKEYPPHGWHSLPKSRQSGQRCLRTVPPACQNPSKVVAWGILGTPCS